MKCLRLSYFFLIFSFFVQAKEEIYFNKVVLWGHKLHSHTHSYIHYGFFKAFKHLGYETYWLDNSDDISKIDFSNALFITEGQVDQKIPIRPDCFYVLHYCNNTKYLQMVDQNRLINLFAYLKPCEYYHGNQKMADYVFYNIVERAIHMPWATDLLPVEIDLAKQSVDLNQSNLHAVFIGSCSGNDVYGNVNQINLFRKACAKNGCQFISIGGYGNAGFVDNDYGLDLIKNAYLAPAIQGQWQADFGYIPCRIFKNISYGKLGITNNATVYELFNKQIVYNPDCYELFFDAYNRMQTITQDELFEQMDFVRDHHTYLNRIDSLLKFLDWVFKC